MNLTWISILCLMLAAAPKCEQTFLDQCCQYGEDLATKSIIGSTDSLLESVTKHCSPKNVRAYIVTMDTKVIKPRSCAALAKSCCLKQYRRKQCRIGATFDGDCESLADDNLGSMVDIKLECCLCCQQKSPISMDTFENCKLLNGRCPVKVQHVTVTSINYQSSTIDTVSNTTDQYSMDTPELINATTSSSMYFNDNTTEVSLTNETSPVYLETNSSTFGYHQYKPGSTVVTATDPRTSTPKPMQCDTGYEWDPRLQVCAQMMISCPKKFVLHPSSRRCVPLVRPNVPCPSGFSYNQFTNKCVDIDECRNTTICVNKTQICVNTIGSYQCDCVKGFKLNKMGACADIDECLNSSICPEDKKCRNRIGSYKCVRAIPCGFGWKEDSETNECVDIDECESFPDICGVGMKCVNIRGSHKCEDEECPNNMRRNNRGKCSQCRDGFRMNNSSNKCEDIDECTEVAHFYKGRCTSSENCFNIPGSYECVPKKTCRSGTLLSKNGTVCEDIDECKEMTYRCDSDDICINTHASFQCVASPCAPSQYYDYGKKRCFCKEGYRHTGDNNCEDIDECSDAGYNVQCGSMYRCVNNPGGYVCINKINCTKGMYRPSINSICQDIDECETGEGKCPINMYCVNMVGSYKCHCDRGFILLKNNTCADINECLLFRPEESCPDLEARCVNTPGSYKCQCAKGFEWSDYPMKKCIDIDECQSKSNPCGQMHTCINIIGGYKCQCHKGFRLTLEGDKCEDIDECSLVPKKCVNGRCTNIPGRYSCQCPKGFILDNKEVCQDFDECQIIRDICPAHEISSGTSRRCLNLYGYYKCVNNSCPFEYALTQLGNGYECILNTEHHCDLHNVGCLHARPYRKTVQFIEISSDNDFPRILARINVGHLPNGNQRINLQVKYSHHTDTKEPIDIQKAFQLSRSRNRMEDIEIVLRYPIVAPSEVLLYLRTNVHHRDMYLGNSEAYVHLYFTKYPDII